jgi:hypothetical protein
MRLVATTCVLASTFLARGNHAVECLVTYERVIPKMRTINVLPMAREQYAQLPSR